MKSTQLTLACVLLSAFCSAATASGPCYTVYGKKDVIVYRSEEPPVDLSRPIYASMAERFPGGHLVMQSGAAECPRVLPAGTPSSSFGVGPDDSPALQLSTPFPEKQVRTESSGSDGKRPAKKARGTARADESRSAPAAAASPSAVTVAAAQATAAAPDAAAGADGFRMTSFRHAGGRVMASFSRGTGSRSRR